MGHTGSKLKKIRYSFRRMSLAKSQENLKYNENDSRIKHSRSLTNLIVKKRDNIKDTEEKKARRNTVVVVSPTSQVSKAIEIDSINKEHDNIRENNEETDTQTAENIAHEKEARENEKLNEIAPEKTVNSTIECSSVLALKFIDNRLKELENQIEKMSHEDLFVYHSTFKDEIHNYWIKAYEIKESNDRVKPKKNETIEYVKKLLYKLNQKLFERKRNSVSYC